MTEVKQSKAIALKEPQSPSEYHWQWLHFNEFKVSELHKCMAARQEVFIIEQGCFYLDADEFDQDAYHLCLWDSLTSSKRLIGYLRAYCHQNTWQIGRVLVSKEKRGQSLGKQLMHRCHQELSALTTDTNLSIELSAQVQVLNFYTALGYEPFGEVYDDAGIAHQNMRLSSTVLQESSEENTKRVNKSVPKRVEMESKKLSTIIFDFDGTLVDSAYDYAVSFQSLSKAWDPQLTPPNAEKIRSLMFAGVKPQIEYALGQLDEAEYQRALELFRVVCMQTPLHHTAPYPGIISLLQTLKKAGYQLAVCTNRPQDLCVQALEALEMSQYFAAVVGGDRGLERKPSPDMLFELFKTLDVKAESCVLVGDSLVDVEAAMAAGCIPIAVHWGYTPHTEFEHYDSLQEVSHVSALQSLLIHI